jgi:preprotein translocase subunit SecD
VQLPGIDDPEEALEVIGKTAVLEFYHVEEQFGTPYASEAEASRPPEWSRPSTSPRTRP